MASEIQTQEKLPKPKFRVVTEYRAGAPNIPKPGTRAYVAYFDNLLLGEQRNHYRGTSAGRLTDHHERSQLLLHVHSSED